MSFLKSRLFLFTVLLQIAGPYFFSFGDWANVIQYLSGFGMAYALWDYHMNHKEEINLIKKELTHLHQKHDATHELLKEKK